VLRHTCVTVGLIVTVIGTVFYKLDALCLRIFTCQRGTSTS